jgi:hypothetical protein
MMAGFFHRIDDPIPMAGSLQSYLASRRQRSQILAVKITIMIDAYRPGSISVLINRNENGELLVCVAPDVRPRPAWFGVGKEMEGRETSDSGAWEARSAGSVA